MKINAEKFTSKAAKFIRKTVSNTGFSKVIVAVSGGVDSSTTLVLCIKALGVENVLAVMLPYSKMSKVGVDRSNLITTRLKVPKENQILVDIERKVSPFLQTGMDQIRKGNIMARVRMVVLYDLAKKHRALVCGTENKSEYLLGYFTRFGDEASDLEPIRNLYKTQVYQLAEYLDVPEEILSTSPTAGLWEGQTDENELGFSYAEADPILHLLIDKKMDIEEIIKEGFDKELVKKVKAWVDGNEFKHRLPYVFSFQS